MDFVEGKVHGRERDPSLKLIDRVNELEFGNSHLIREWKISDLQKVSIQKQHPIISIVVLRIPRTSLVEYQNQQSQFSNSAGKELKSLPYSFPATTIREIVCSPMVEARCSVQLDFPCALKIGETLVEELCFLMLLIKLLHRRIMHVLRFEHGETYTVNVGRLLADHSWSRCGNVRGVITVKFSCDLYSSSKLVDCVLDEVLRLQVEGPSDDDVSAILESDQLAYETGLEQNYHWWNRIVRSYVSPAYIGDPSCCFIAEITAAEVSKFAENYRTSCNCVIVTIEPRSHVTIEDLSSSVLKINSLEKEGSISNLEHNITKEIVSRPPDLG
ncbi:hypothetical protein BVC80_209g248 [Macleaya cordata]|uniref:Uncharacterized protein n=1 Tax=Macleaya cordata TaxID=56857 RepID=A0A200QDF2_MACCD|nr:hypothetical protein BVC80_209g248 [Macleaya cordata]